MFTTKEQKRVAEEISTSSNNIGKGTFLQGNIETYGNIRIEGKVKGDITSKSKIALGQGCQVEGNIIAQNADIEGEVKGRVEVTELLVLKSTAVVNGDISTGKMIVETGAVFNGSCKMGIPAKEIKISDANGGLTAHANTIRQGEAKAN
jgi:cytoskeletal protein CcmA (bactofilin family)